ncbi:MAG: AsmA-like C-terminal region-containing protein [Pseudolabrys sp.]
MKWTGTGLSPIALIGSLQGTGKLTLADAQFAGLDPRAFDAVTRAVDQGLPVDGIRISDVVGKALDSGQLSVKQTESALAVSAGQLRLGNTAAASKDSVLSFSGNLDLIDGTMDARLVLTGSSQAAGAKPDIFMALKGPVGAPSRSIDVSALSGWLTLRAVENQSKKLRAMEEASPQPAAQAPALPAPIEIVPQPVPGRPASAGEFSQPAELTNPRSRDPPWLPACVLRSEAIWPR